jgi:hypothetical protein
VTEADASMLQHVARHCRLGVGREVRGCANDRRPKIWRHANGHHILRDVLPELNTCVETG